MPWALYLQGMSPWYPFDRKLSGAQSLDTVVKRKNLCPAGN